MNQINYFKNEPKKILTGLSSINTKINVLYKQTKKVKAIFNSRSDTTQNQGIINYLLNGNRIYFNCVSEITCQHEHILKNNPYMFLKMGTLW